MDAQQDDGMGQDGDIRQDEDIWPTAFGGLRASLQAEERRRRWRLSWRVVLLTVIVVLLFWAGWQRMPRSDTAQAVREAQAAIALARQLKENWALFYNGDHQAASAAFRATLVEAPHDVEAHAGLGWALYENGQVDEAQTIFEAALRLAPYDGACTNGLAWCLASTGQTEQAITLWEGMLERYPSPGGGGAAIGLGLTYLERGDCAQAMPYLERLRWRRDVLAWVDEGLSRCEGTAPGA